MKIVDVLRVEVFGFLGLLGGVILYQMLTRRVYLGGLFLRPGGTRAVAPERIQLLLATLWLCAGYLQQVVHSSSGKMPDVSPEWLYVFGASSGTYLGAHALAVFGRGAGK